VNKRKGDTAVNDKGEKREHFSYAQKESDSYAIEE